MMFKHRATSNRVPNQGKMAGTVEALICKEGEEEPSYVRVKTAGDGRSVWNVKPNEIKMKPEVDPVRRDPKFATRYR